ncbi:hypothetical protein LOD99_658 [Oopsacas minuta]|uniref:Uncharacterized protein n=1 Tax=Oopsacas minuta TaxID=111878 RepID=A0AAV7K0Y3_9METZ|nr:hypothetical protein LOD99_658 [Oopsacas minuta]
MATNSKLAVSGTGSLTIASNTPPQVSTFAISSVEKELDASFIRALHLLHSTDPDAKNELKRLVEQQIEQATANQASKPKSAFSFDGKKLFNPVRLKEKSPQVVTTTTTLVSGGVNTMHMEDIMSPLSTSKLPTVKEQFINRLSSSSSDEESPIPINGRRLPIPLTKQSSPKRLKLTHRALLGDSDDSVDNSTDNDSFEELLKETDKTELHHTPIQKPTSVEQRPRLPQKSTTAFIQLPVDKNSSGHIKQRPLSNMTHKKLIGGHPSRVKNKKMKFVKKQSFKRK